MEEDEEKKGREEYCLLFEGEPMSLKLRHVLERLESIETDRNRNLASMLERENKWMDEGSTVRRMRVLVRYLMRTLDLIVDIGFDVFIRIVQFEVQDRCRKENVSEKSNAMLKDLRKRSSLFSALYDAAPKDVTAGVFETNLCMKYRETRKDWIILERRCATFDELTVGNAREVLLCNTIRWCQKLTHRADQTLEELLILYSSISPFEYLLQQKVQLARRCDSPADFSVPMNRDEDDDDEDDRRGYSPKKRYNDDNDRRDERRSPSHRFDRGDSDDDRYDNRGKSSSFKSRYDDEEEDAIPR